ncbi:MAG: metallophosphoesterase [Clostridium sp.]|nr:metallophosphoesterase [Clostridium sp.]
MKILIVSDTHRKNENYWKVLRLHSPLDMVIHCGDSEGSESSLNQGSDCQVRFVLGNNDYFSSLPQELEFQLGKYKVWVTHGHSYRVSLGNDWLKKEARAKGADIVLYGHTHRPVVDYSKGVIAVNPGSLSYPRQDGRRPSYVVMEIDRKGEAHFTISYL